MLRIITLSATLLLCLVSGGGFSQTFSVKLEAKKYASGSNIRCNGGNDGEIQVQLSGGIAPITLLWNDGQTGNFRTGLSAGTYWVTATDSSGNLAADTLTLVNPGQLLVETEKTVYAGGYHISIAGETNGQMLVNISGGIAPYVVMWSDSTFGTSKLNLSGGQYAYTVTDANGCTVAKNEALQEPSALMVQVQILSEVSCANANDGRAQVNISGGVPPYTIEWSSGETEATAEALDGLRAFVKVSDLQDAGVMLPVAFTVPPKLSENVTVSQYPGGYQVSCADCYNGSIALEVTGGTPPYSVVWADTGALENPFQRQNLGGRFYDYTITDANQCKLKGFVELTEPKRRGWQLSGNTEINANEQYLGTNDTSSFVVKTNATLALKIDAEGKVGLGTEPNAARLNVAGDVEGSGGLKLPNLNQFNDTNLQAMQNLRLVAMQDDGTLLKLGTQFPIADLYPGQACKLTQDGAYVSQWKYQAGNPSLATIGTTNCWPLVGIGTENPLTRLHVNGSQFINGSLQVGGVFSPSILNEYPIFFTQPTQINTNGQTALYIKNRQETDLGYATIIEVDRIKTKAISVQNTSSSGNETFVVYGDGTTLIGNNPNISPDNETMLAVQGQISARKIKVTQGLFPDYVFEKDYEKMSIHEIEKYIINNGHLPGVMSACEVEEDGGFELGALSLQNLEKIEELFLLIIEMEKRLMALEEENEKLKRKNKK